MDSIRSARVCGPLYRDWGGGGPHAAHGGSERWVVRFSRMDLEVTLDPGTSGPIVIGAVEYRMLRMAARNGGLSAFFDDRTKAERDWN